MKKMIKKIFKYFLPYGIVRFYLKKRTKSLSELEQILSGEIKKGTTVNTVIDVGASDGRWSSNVMIFFPDSNYLLIEANDIHKKELDKFVEDKKNAEYILAAAGDQLGQIYFDNSDPFGGLAMYEKANENLVRVPATTIDHCVKEKKLKGPYLIKLDTHGFEIPIFEGAVETLKDTNLIVVEAYNFHIAKSGLLFYEMCEYMLEKGFRCAGIIDVTYRPKDNMLWQMDLVFVKTNRNEFTDNKYA